MNTEQLEGNPGPCVGSLGLWVIPGEGAYLIIRSIVQDTGDTVVRVSRLELRWAALWAVRRLGAPQRLAVARCSWGGGGGMPLPVHAAVRPSGRIPSPKPCGFLLAPPTSPLEATAGKCWLASDSLTVSSSCKVPVRNVMFFRRKALKSDSVSTDPMGGP